MDSFQTTGCQSPEQALAAWALEIMPPPVKPLEVRGIRINIATKIVTIRTTNYLPSYIPIQRGLMEITLNLFFLEDEYNQNHPSGVHPLIV